MEHKNTEDYYLLSLRYCADKYDYDAEQKRKIEFRKMDSKNC